MCSTQLLDLVITRAMSITGMISSSAILFNRSPGALAALLQATSLAASSGFKLSIPDLVDSYLWPARAVGIQTENMAARNRPRGALLKDDPTDAHEERNMWSQIVTDIKRLRNTHARAAEVAKLQVEMEAKMGDCKKHPSR